MSDEAEIEPEHRHIAVTEWVRRAEADPVAHLQRQATDLVLHAIATAAPFDGKLLLKGGVLMGLAYGSFRQTTDVDLTAAFAAAEGTGEEVRASLDTALERSRTLLGYDRLRARVQSVRELPRQHYPDAQFPALKIKVGYAQDTGALKKLAELQASDTVQVDISFNEPLRHIQVLDLDGGQALYAYGHIDLVAEKYRAMLQQRLRNRARRQDVYDLHHLLTTGALEGIDQGALHEALLVKCRSRGIEPTQNDLDDSEVHERAGRDWDTLALELGAVPPFEECYEAARTFYRALPW